MKVCLKILTEIIQISPYKCFTVRLTRTSLVGRFLVFVQFSHNNIKSHDRQLWFLFLFIIENIRVIRLIRKLVSVSEQSQRIQNMYLEWVQWHVYWISSFWNKLNWKLFNFILKDIKLVNILKFMFISRLYE